VIPVCPRCGSTAVHSSRTKGALDRIARLAALPPRRCSACGWRGYRPRVLFPSKHGSNPELPAVQPAAEPAPAQPQQPQPLPTASDPAPEPEKEKETEKQRAAGRRRRHRHRHHIKTKNAAWKVALLAVGMGAALGYVVLGLGR